MESYQIDLLSKFSHSCVILPYYSYADVGINMMKSLNKACNELINSNMRALTNGFSKRTIKIANIFNEYTIAALEKNDRYKLFIYDVNLIDLQNNFENFYTFYSSHPEIQFKKLELYVNHDLETANNIYDLFGESKQVQESAEFPYNIIKIEYESRLDYNPDIQYRQVQSIINLSNLNGNTGRFKIVVYDWYESDPDFYVYHKYISIGIVFIDKIDQYTLGSTEFVNSVKNAIIMIDHEEIDLDTAFETLKSYFPNIETLNVELGTSRNLEIKEMHKWLSKPYLKCISKSQSLFNCQKWENRSLNLYFHLNDGYRMTDGCFKIHRFDYPFKIKKTKSFGLEDLDELITYDNFDTLTLIEDNCLSLTHNFNCLISDTFPIPNENVTLELNNRDLTKLYKSAMNYIKRLPSRIDCSIYFINLLISSNVPFKKLLSCILTEAKGGIYLIFYFQYFNVFYQVFESLTKEDLQNVRSIKISFVNDYVEDLVTIVKNTHEYIHWKLHISYRGSDGLLDYKPLAELKNVWLEWNFPPKYERYNEIRPMYAYGDYQEIS